MSENRTGLRNSGYWRQFAEDCRGAYNELKGIPEDRRLEKLNRYFQGYDILFDEWPPSIHLPNMTARGLAMLQLVRTGYFIEQEDALRAAKMGMDVVSNPGPDNLPTLVSSLDEAGKLIKNISIRHGPEFAKQLKEYMQTKFE